MLFRPALAYFERDMIIFTCDGLLLKGFNVEDFISLKALWSCSSAVF
jgi:hypothetical protein